MKNILLKIRESLPEMAGMYQSIAYFVLSNETEISRLAIHQVAERCKTSQATVVRFCKHFGMEGYKDFRRQITIDMLEQYGKPTQRPNRISDLIENEGISSLILRITTNNINSIVETRELIDPNIIKKTIDILETAPRVDFYGAGASGLVALDAHLKFIRIGKICNTSQDSHIQMTLASTMKEGDAAVIISYSGRSKDIVETATVAKERGAAIIAITKYGAKNPLAELADIVLYCISPELIIRSGATGSRIAQLTIIDILFAGIASRNVSIFNENLERSFLYAAKKKLT